MTVPQIPGARVRSRHGGTTWEVRAERMQAVQQLAVTAVGASALTDLDLTVAHWRPPMAGWLGRPGIPGIRELEVAARGSGVRLRIRTGEPVDAAVLLGAAARCLRPFPTGDARPMLTFTPGLPAAAATLAGDLRDVLLPGESRDAHVRRCDVLVTAEAVVGVLPASSHVVRVTPDAWVRDGQAFDVCVDPTVHRPVGRRSTGVTGVASAQVAGDRVVIASADGAVTIDHDVSPGNVAALRSTQVVVSDEIPIRIGRQLQACGLLVVGSGVALPDASDDLGWQSWSVHERRHALRQHGPSAALDAWPTVSVLLVTNRPDHLAHALRQLSGLRYPRLEVVIGAHGERVDAARVRDLAHEVPHPVTVVAIDGGRALGEALQACSDRAEGSLLTKMDDDDVYGPEHVWDLVLARLYSGAQVVGKALDWVYLEASDTTVFRPTYPAEKYADFVAGGTILISRGDLAEVGGWRPVPKSVDRALLDRVLADGGLVYRTHGLGYVYVRHSAGHTAAVKDEHFLTRTTSTHAGLVRHPCFGTEDGRYRGGAA